MARRTRRPAGQALGAAGQHGAWPPSRRRAPRVLISFGLALTATSLVGRAAWPLYGARGTEPDDDATELARTSRRLTTGLALTFVSIALLALAGTSSWWPSRGGSSATVELQAGGSSVCGELAATGPGAVRVETDEQPVEVPISELSGLRPVDGC